MVLLNAETLSASAARAMESSVAAVNSKRLDSWHKHEQIALAMEKQKSKLGNYKFLKKILFKLVESYIMCICSNNLVIVFYFAEKLIFYNLNSPN